LITDKWIGYNDVKSAPVHFSVQRNSKFILENTRIPFDIARVNERSAMDLASGIFTAPQAGIYFFSFGGVAHYSSSSSSFYFSSRLHLNGNIILVNRVDEVNSVTNKRSPLTLQSTMNLKKGDLVWVTIWHSSTLHDPNCYLFNDGDSQRINFTGFVLEEEIVASL
jgi:hypothetical protein